MRTETGKISGLAHKARGADKIDRLPLSVKPVAAVK